VSVTAAVPLEARTEQYNRMKRQRDDLLRRRRLDEEDLLRRRRLEDEVRKRAARKMEEERAAARQRVFDDLARQFAEEQARAARVEEDRAAARKRRAVDVPIGAYKRARTRYYHGADDEFFTVNPPWRRPTRRPVCFDHDPYNEVFCNYRWWCNKEHLDTRDTDMRRRFAAALRSYYGR